MRLTFILNGWCLGAVVQGTWCDRLHEPAAPSAKARGRTREKSWARGSMWPTSTRATPRLSTVRPAGRARWHDQAGDHRRLRRAIRRPGEGSARADEARI